MALFKDRRDAGRRLAQRLGHHRSEENLVVLALPRGGVPVAYEVATALVAPLDVFVVRQLGVPRRAGLAMGAIATGGAIILNSDVIRIHGLSPDDVEAARKRETAELVRREGLYRQGRPPLTVDGQSVILVDDGRATGATMIAAIAALRSRAPKSIVVAVPVVAAALFTALAAAVDELLCLARLAPFHGVGQWYEDFAQVLDDEVVALLDAANSRPLPGRRPATRPSERVLDAPW